MHNLKHLLTSVEAIAALLGLSAIGVISACHALYARAMGRLRRRRDRRALGDGEYATWVRAATQSGEDIRGARVTRRIATTGADLSGSMTTALVNEIRDRLAKPASGTLGLSYADLLNDPDLLIDQRFVDANGTVLASASRGILANETEETSYRTLVLVGDAGTGKSMVCRAVEKGWLEDVAPARWLLTIEPQHVADYRGDGRAVVGSRDWLLNMIERRFFAAPLSPFERKVMNAQLDTLLELIIDGLDEIADQMSPADGDRFLNSWVMRQAAIVAVRSSFYETTFAANRAFATHRVAVVEEPNEPDLLRYIDALSRRLYTPAEAKMHAAAAKALRDRIGSLRELTRNPLLLAMYVSLKDFDHAGTPTTSGVYREFVRQSLNRERVEGRTLLPLDVLIPALCEIAWLGFVSETSFVTRKTLHEAVASLSEVPSSERMQVVHDLQGCSLLTLREAPPATGEDYRASFYHKSFQDYFVARRAEEWLCSRASERGSDFFSHIDTPEVTFFFKEAVDRINRDDQLRDAAATRLKGLLVSLLDQRNTAADETTARMSSFAAGQAAYYLGMIRDSSAQGWLEELAERETVFWVRRAAVIGLLFGGAPEACHRFIDEMRSRMTHGDMGMARMNIAVELGFYGDQTFDPLDPAYDRGGASCRRLVGRSILELDLDVEAANWRMILFNLNYLARHRPVSLESFREEIVVRQTELRAALNSIANDPMRSRYPEIGELLGSLDDLAG